MSYKGIAYTGMTKGVDMTARACTASLALALSTSMVGTHGLGYQKGVDCA